MAVIISQTIQGLDVPFIRDNLTENGINKETLKNYVTDVLLHGIVRRQEP